MAISRDLMQLPDRVGRNLAWLIFTGAVLEERRGVEETIEAVLEEGEVAVAVVEAAEAASKEITTINHGRKRNRK